MNHPTIIEAQNLNFFYGDYHALKNINIKVQEHRVTALIGPSGCGKSTMIRVMNRMSDLVPESRATGLLSILGRDIFAPASDVTELRRIEGEIRALNSELEQRVERRTAELFEANARLSTTIEHLKLTQAELVRSEKLASLGALVAGIAHELNTPLGNGVMALSTLIASLRTFRKEMESGIKRSSLDKLLEAMDAGTDIAFRNLSRAAELVASFKQVAADQSSSQRRSFMLGEVIEEIILTLRPLLKRHDVAVRVDIAEGLSMDSYPGPLGQVVTNLISNAVTHAFDGRSERRITISATAEGDEAVRITLADNGTGIPDTLLPRIFDPFVTTRMGRGGVGLGLHICHNLVIQTLGGRIAVASTAAGTTFTLTLPLCAPGEQSAHG